MFGVEMLMKGLGLNPDDIIKTINGITETVVIMKAQLDRIEANQRLIMASLNINAENTDGTEH